LSQSVVELEQIRGEVRLPRECVDFYREGANMMKTWTLSLFFQIFVGAGAPTAVYYIDLPMVSVGEGTSEGL
jgi:hypothetical protein